MADDAKQTFPAVVGQRPVRQVSVKPKALTLAALTPSTTPPSSPASAPPGGCWTSTPRLRAGGRGRRRLAGHRPPACPKTIDNDLDCAAPFATDCIDRLHTTAASHHRVLVVELMGRYAGWIALHAGLAGGAHAILLPELSFDLAPVAELIRRRDADGRAYSIVVVGEGARPRDGTRVLLAPAEAGHAERLGGMGEQSRISDRSIANRHEARPARRPPLRPEPALCRFVARGATPALRLATMRALFNPRLREPA